MSRVVKIIEIEGQSGTALFDTGAVYTYVRENLLSSAVPRREVPCPFRVALGGRSIEVQETCLIVGKIEGLDFNTDAVPVKEIGKVNGQELDILIGALTMERWEIKIDPKSGMLDLEGLRRREFTEFASLDLEEESRPWNDPTIIDPKTNLSIGTSHRIKKRKRKA